MPSFSCTVCGGAFDVSPASIAKYPGWQPKYCRTHSPSRKRAASSAREENLTLEQVLAKYQSGPTSGVFTDGSSIPNPGPGGWGVVWVEQGEIRAQSHGHDADTTNNRMELTALIEAYRLLPERAEVTVRTDSRLCVDTITKWAPGWKLRGWKKKGGPIKNLELVQELLALYRAHPDCRLEWIAAHSGARWNEYADSLSTAWMRAEP
jgi:ribonuclease HI